MDHVRFSTRALVLAGALAAAAFTLLLSSAPPAHAIGEPFVSNIGKADSTILTPSDSTQYAQAFTTGPTGGYEVDTVDVRFNHGTDFAASTTVAIWSSTVTSTSTLPNASVCALTNPNNLDTGGTKTFTTTSCTLSSSTTYFVHLAFSGTSSDAYGVRNTRSTDEDSGGLPGWSIADRFHINDGNWQQQASFRASRAIKIRLRGANVAPTAADNTVQADLGDTYEFDRDDFGFSDHSGDELEEVTISSVAGGGVLWLDANDNDTFDAGEAVSTTTSTDVTRAEIDAAKLRYTPPDTGGAGLASFNFTVSDGDLDSAQHTMTIDVFSRLVSNLGQTTDGHTTQERRRAQGFVTGSNLKGYRLQSVDLRVDDNSETEGVNLKIVRNSDSDRPGAELCDLGSTATSQSGSVLRFSTSTNVCALKRDTRYHVVFVEAVDGSYANWAYTFDATVEDAGWRIIRGQARQSTTATSGWTRFTNIALKMGLKGQIIPNALPTSQSGSVTTDEDTVYTFATTSLPFADADTTDQGSVRITGLPDSGTLWLDADGSGTLEAREAISTNTLIAQTEINKLRYTPPTDRNGAAFTSFNFRVNDGYEDSADTYKMTINVRPEITGATTTSYAENGVGTVGAYSIDGSPTWGLSGVDNGHFTISNSGELSFINSPNYEDPQDANADNDYQVTVEAVVTAVVDNVLYSATGTLDVTVSVTDVDFPPVAVDDYATTTEGAAVVVNVLANDTDVEGDTLSLTDVTDPPNGAAVLDAGAVSTTTYTPDTGFAGFDRFTYTVTDGSLTAMATATVGVLPTITGATTTSYSESGQVTVATYNANGSPTWGLAGVDAGDFTISNDEGDNGELNFVTPPDLESPADSDGSNVYNVFVTASITDDVTGNTVTSELAVTVTVTSLTDEPPVIHGGTNVTVTGTGARRLATAPDFPENSTSTVATLTVDDDDAGHEIVEVALSGLDYGSFSATSSTSTATVTLSFNTAPDFENPTDLGADNTYFMTLTVKTASSTAATSTYLSTSILIEVTVTDLPAVSAASGTSTPSYAENGTDAVDTYSATGAVGTVTWSLEGPDADQFEIPSGGGELDFSSPPNYELPADANQDNVYEVTVVATDDNGTAGDATDDEVSSRNVRVTVTDANDAPVANPEGAGTLPDARIVIGVLENDTDEDGDPLTVTDASVTGINIGSATTTNDGAAVEFTPNPGAIGQTTVSYTVSDGRGGADTGSVTVLVYHGAWYLNDLVISDLTSDLGFNPEVTEYSASVESTVDSVVVTPSPYVDPLSESYDNKAVTVNGTPVTSDNPNVRIDLGGEVSTTTIEIAVTVEGTDPPRTRTYTVSVFRKLRPTPPDVSGPANINYDENGVGPVGTYNASDPNGDPTTWEALSGVDAGLFSFDAGAATLSFREAPDFESPADANRDNVYLVTLTVSDGTFADTIDVTVTVDDVNEPPTTVGTVIDQTTLTAGDPPWRLDLSSNFADVDSPTLTYSVSSSRNGVASARITSAGTLSVTPLAAGSATIVVSASDGASNNDPATWTITVTVDEAPTDQQDSRAQRSAAASASAAPVPVAPVIDGPPGEITAVAADEESDDTMVVVNPDQQTTVAAAEQDVTVVFPVSSRQDAFQARVTGCTIEDPAVGPLLACVTVDLFDAAGQRERDAQLSTPAGVNITLTPEQVEDVGGLSMLRTANDLGGLRLLKRDAATGSWTEVAVTLSVDEETGQATVSGSIFRFGDFVLVLDDEVIAQALASSDLLPRTGGPHVPGHILLALLIAGAALTAAGLRLLQTRRQTA